MRRLVVAPRAVETVGLMQDVGILPIVLAGIGYIATFERLVAFETAVGVGSLQAPLRLAALACRIEEDVARVAQKLRLCQRRARPHAGGARRRARLSGRRRTRATRAVALYRHGPDAYRDGVALAAAWSAGAARRRALAQALRRCRSEWTAPAFPLCGRDVVGQGAAPSPAVGEVLRAVEAWWIEHDFAPDEAALRRRLRQVMAKPR